MCVDDPRASRTSFATSHLAVVYRGVPYDVLVMIDLHFFETKKSRARIRPVCPEGLCSRPDGVVELPRCFVTNKNFFSDELLAWKIPGHQPHGVHEEKRQNIRVYLTRGCEVFLTGVNFFDHIERWQSQKMPTGFEELVRSRVILLKYSGNARGLVKRDHKTISSLLEHIEGENEWPYDPISFGE